MSTQNVLQLHSLRVHSCALMLNNICSESMSPERMSLYSIVFNMRVCVFLSVCLCVSVCVCVYMLER